MFSLFNFQQCVAVLCFIFFSAVSSQNPPSSKESVSQTLTTIAEKLNNLEKLSKESKEQIVKLEKDSVSFNKDIQSLLSLHQNKGCPDPNWRLLNGQCYRLFSEKKSWHHAKAVCESHLGHLVEIRDESTNTMLHDSLYRINQHAFAWIGLNDLETFDRYVWEGASKPASPYFNWTPFRQPRNIRKQLGYNYGRMEALSGTWDMFPDYGTPWTYPFFCQKEQWTIPRN